MNEYSESYEKEISLIELFFYCLRKWRWIVCSMIVIAVAMGGYQYLSTIKNNQLQQQQRALLEKDGEIVVAEVVKNPRIRYYEQAIASSEQELGKQEIYLKDSIVMQLDAYHLQGGTLTFYLTMSNEQDENSINNLIAAYRAYVTDGRLAQQLSNIDDRMSVADLGYLLSFSRGGESIDISLNSIRENSNGSKDSLNLQSGIPLTAPEQNVFQIRIIAPNEEIGTVYLEKIQEAIMAYGMKLKEEVAEHNLKILAATQSEIADNEIVEYQSAVVSSYAMLLDNLKTLKADMEAVQKEEGETITLGRTFEMKNPISEAIKHGIVGLVIGAFFVVFILCLSYLMSGRLQSIARFEEEFGMKLLGSVALPIRKKWFGFLDRFIYRVHEGAYANIPFEEQVKIAAANIRAAISQDSGLKKIVFAGTIALRDVEDICTRLKENIKGIEFSDYQQPVFSAEALEKLKNADGVVFLEKREISVSKYIHQERELAFRRNIKVLGVVVL